MARPLLVWNQPLVGIVSRIGGKAMNMPLRLPDDLSFDTNPYVGELAERLRRSFHMRPITGEPDRIALIEKVLAFAADAEQRVAALQSRISYLESLSKTDELTGLANRRGLDNFLQQTLSSARRHGEGGVVGYIDVDNFKRINDTHGHDAGDKVLRKVSEILSQNVRLSDFVARPGGDEFVVVLARSETRQGKNRIRNLRRIINSTKVEYGEVTIPVQVSCGVATFGSGSCPNDLMRSADRAMYAQKSRRGADRRRAT
jgi:diguanylate cyclase (GGDEF)-like protein